MPAPTRQQVAAYMKFRVSPCGDWESLPFAEPDFDLIYAASGGLPGGINILARTRLQEKLRPHTVGGSYRAPLVLLMVLVLAAGVFLFYQNIPDREPGTRMAVSETRGAVTTGRVDQEHLAGTAATLPGSGALSQDSLSLKLSDVLRHGAGEGSVAR